MPIGTVSQLVSQAWDNNIQWKTFEGENIHEFCGFRATCESFLLQIWACPYPPTCMLGFSIPRKFSPLKFNGHSYQSAKVFSLESFLLYGIYSVNCKLIIIGEKYNIIWHLEDKYTLMSIWY